MEGIKMPISPKKKALQVSIPPDIVDWVTEYAKQQRVHKCKIVTLALRKYRKDLGRNRNYSKKKLQQKETE